jgi:hypothetical protein
MEVTGQLKATIALSPRKEPPPPANDWIGGWVGRRIGLDAVVKRKIFSPYRESNAGRLARNLVTILTELPRLHLCRLFTTELA